MTSPTEISVSQLNRLIGTASCPPVFDVRTDEDFNDAPLLIPGARRYDFADIESLVETYKGKKLVLYCQKGLKISQGAAAILRDGGVFAQTLKGGRFVWHDAGLPQVPVDKIPNFGTGKSSLWVTRHRPKVDRIACPRLIRRFVDPDARFLFVSPSEVLSVAEKFNATPFDVEGVFWSHRGALCTFDTMVEEFGLHGEALDRLAIIIRGADTNNHELVPQSAGLLAAALRLSRIYKDDLEQLGAGFVLFDAFYSWSRDAVNEIHDWPIVEKGAGR